MLHCWLAGKASTIRLTVRALPVVCRVPNTRCPVSAAVMAAEKPGHTLTPTALVHEAYLKLVRPRDSAFKGRRHFMNVAAMAMRQILANQARDRRRLKRGGDAARVTIGQAEGVPADGSGDTELDFDLIALDDALTRLQEIDPDLSRVVELRFLTGLTIDETADILGVDEKTVRRHWLAARAWLRAAMDEFGS